MLAGVLCKRGIHGYSPPGTACLSAQAKALRLGVALGVVLGVVSHVGRPDWMPNASQRGDSTACHSAVGVLDGGSPMSHVNVKKWQCPLSYFQNFPVNSKIVQCPLSILRNENVPCRYVCSFLSIITGSIMSPSNSRKGPVDLSSLRFKGPTVRLQVVWVRG